MGAAGTVSTGAIDPLEDIIPSTTDSIRSSRAAAEHPELEAVTQELSIATFRYLPPGSSPVEDHAYLNEVNAALLDRLKAGGEAYVSNAIVDVTFLLRACIVDLRTTSGDVRSLPDLVVRLGREVAQESRPGQRA